jgi:hypothetical protein
MPLTRRDTKDCRGVLGVGAAVFGRADFAWGAGGLVPEVLWLLGPAGLCTFDQLSPRPPAEPPSRLFQSGGYVVMRSAWTPDAHQLVLDVGPLGCPLSAGHGHADLLSLQCFPFGEDCLVDPGTYCYTPEPRWRAYFRGTHAHGTVVVDGEDQALSAGPFRWHSRPSARLRRWRMSPDIELVDADHDAYSRLPDPVSHRRRVLFVNHKYWIVVDDLNGAAVHRIELRFQFAAPALRLGPKQWVAAPGRTRRGLWLAPFSTSSLSFTVHEGEENPIAGWVSSEYGTRHPAPALVYATTAQLPVRIVTLLMPVERLLAAPPMVSPVYDGGELVGLHLAGRRETVRFEPRELVHQENAVEAVNVPAQVQS